MHNLVLRVDQEYTNAIQVIDLPISTNDLKDLVYEDLFEFNVHSNDTIVREFKYDTQIPDALKSTIAINAQSGATADDLDSVTFAAFNRSIKSRLSSLSEKFSDNEANNYKKLYKIKIEKEERLIELKKIIDEYSRLFFNLLIIMFFEARTTHIYTYISAEMSAIINLVYQKKTIEIRDSLMEDPGSNRLRSLHVFGRRVQDRRRQNVNDSYARRRRAREWFSLTVSS